MDKKERWFALTTGEMFEMIKEFADELLEYLKERESVNTEKMMRVSKNILSKFDAEGLDGRLVIILLLQAAVALHQVMIENFNLPKKSVN
jgi:hypothetical protein